MTSGAGAEPTRRDRVHASGAGVGHGPPPVIGDPYGSLTFAHGDPSIPVYNSEGLPWVVHDAVSGSFVAEGMVSGSAARPGPLTSGLYTLSVSNSDGTTSADFLVLETVPTTDSYFGVQTHFAFPNPTTWSAPITTLGDLRCVGFSTIRDECYWADVEQSPGTRVVPPRVLTYQNRAASLGMERILTADYGNVAVQGPSGLCDASDPVPCQRVPQTPQEQRWFADYVISVIDQTGVARVELWNEFNNPQFNHRCRSGACYATTMGPVADLIVSDRPWVSVVAGGIAGADLDWFLSFYSGGGLDHAFAALSYHPYTDTPLGDLRTPKSYVDRVAAIRNAQSAFLVPGRSPLPLIISEVGWSTAPASSSGNPARALDDDVQAERMVETFVLHAGDAVQMVVWYEGVDLGYDPASTELNFGAFRTTTPAVRAFQPKRSALAIWTLRCQLDGYVASGRELLTTGVWRTVFSKGPLTKIVLFADGEFTATAPADSHRTTIAFDDCIPRGRVPREGSDIYGRSIDVSGATVTVGTRPVFITLSTPAFSFSSTWNQRLVSSRQDAPIAGAPLQASATTASDWETFCIIEAGRGLIALRSAVSGGIVSVSGPDSRLLSTASTVGDAERFRWISLPGGVFALRSESTGRFVSATMSAAGVPLRASATEILGWERFAWSPR